MNEPIKEKKRIVIKRGEYYVYVYLDPRKPGKYVYGEYKFLHEPIYVGKGKRKRAYHYEKHNPFLKNKLLKFGKPIVIILGKFLESVSLSKERSLIALIGRLDLGKGPLCNLTNGGEGHSGLIHKEETKVKISKSMKGIVRSEEYRTKMSKSLKKRELSEETKKRMISGITGSRRKPSWNKGKKTGPRSENTKRKIAESQIGKIPWNKGKKLLRQRHQK
jgi:hypothetical protein